MQRKEDDHDFRGAVWAMADVIADDADADADVWGDGSLVSADGEGVIHDMMLFISRIRSRDGANDLPAF